MRSADTKTTSSLWSRIFNRNYGMKTAHAWYTTTNRWKFRLVLRPLVSQKDVYEEAMRVSTAAVGLAGKSLAVLLEDRELQRAAGYDDNDVRLARASLANNFSGRDRRRPNLPEICRVDLILTNRGDL